MHLNTYYDSEKIARLVRERKHRAAVGGLWQEIGLLQFDFLQKQGLQPDNTLIDIGCGCLRSGVHLINYMQTGHYYGIDLSQSLLDAGYDIELANAGLQNKLPRANLLCDGDFQVSKFEIMFDYAIAQSVFTHLPINHLKLCLARLAPVMKVGGVFYATFFLCDDIAQWVNEIFHPRGGIITKPVTDPFHYHGTDIRHCANGLPWSVRILGDWNHPRDQQMVVFTRQDA